MKEEHIDELTGLLTFEGIKEVYNDLNDKFVDKEHEVMIVNIKNMSEIVECYGELYARNLFIIIAGMLREYEIENVVYAVKLPETAFMIYIHDCGRVNARKLRRELGKKFSKVYVGEKDVNKLKYYFGYHAGWDDFEDIYYVAKRYAKARSGSKNAGKVVSAEEKVKGIMEEYKNDLDDGSDYTDKIAEYSLFENEIEALFTESKDLRSSLQIALARIGGMYKLNRISVFDIDLEDGSSQISYQWVSDRKYLNKYLNIYISEERENKIRKYFSKKVDVGDVDVSVVAQDILFELRAFIIGTGNISFIISEAKLTGIIIFERSGASSAAWNKVDRYYLIKIGNIIGSYISKLQSDIANRSKTAFLSNMSHEIRTPMNAIVGMTGIARTKINNPEELSECLDKIESSSKHLLSLINDILDLSKIESGRMVLANDVTSLDKILDKVEVLIKPQAEDKKINFKIIRQYVKKIIIADDLRLSQVLINIAGNALKYTGEGGKIVLKVEEITASKDGADIRFSVKDNGIGISKEDQKKIFIAFEQAGNKKAQYGGTGLGLAISNNFVRLMGGKLEVQSEPGEGSEFFFTINLMYPSAEQEREYIENEETGEDYQYSLTGVDVLLVEDDEMNCEISNTILSLNGASVVCAEDGEKALQLFEKSTPGDFNVILMDVNMPVMNGLEATRAIRKLDRKDAQEIPIIAMSANAFAEDVQESLKAGMNAHLTKPIEIKELVKVISKFTKK